MERNELIKEIKRLGINNYEITDHGVNILEDFFLNHRLDKFPFKVNICSGHFNVARNEIKSFENFPNRILGDFHCGWNKIESLENGPEYVGGDYYCYDIPIKTNYCETEIIGDFHTTLTETGLEFIRPGSYVTTNYKQWVKHIKRKKILDKLYDKEKF